MDLEKSYKMGFKLFLKTRWKVKAIQDGKLGCAKRKKCGVVTLS